MDTKLKENFRDSIWEACVALNSAADQPMTEAELSQKIRRSMIELERAVVRETFWGTKLEARAEH